MMSSLQRKTPLKSKTPLKAKTGLKRKTPLKAKGGYAKPSAASIMQAERVSYISGARENLVKHHIYPGSRRKISDELGLWVWLTVDEHTGADGVHNNTGKLRALQAECRERFVALWGEEAFLQMWNGVA